MTTHAVSTDAAADARAITWHLAEEDDHDHGGGGGATLLGVWIYLMTDALLFGAIFSVFGAVILLGTVHLQI